MNTQGYMPASTKLNSKCLYNHQPLRNFIYVHVHTEANEPVLKGRGGGCEVSEMNAICTCVQVPNQVSGMLLG